MPLDSMQIAQMNGAYTGMAANQMAYAQQLSQNGPPQFGGGAGGGYGDQMMGRGLNAAAAIGGPAASAFGALAPMGISAGLGLGMAASTGIGIPIAAGMAGMQYAGSQMYSGAQQQQALNQGMRSSFTFQNSSGGQGFNRGDMSQIGSQLRSMSSQFGPGGEITSFSELSQVASKMGQMGLAQGVKDVQEFSKRFKETVTALKTMAKDLGTTMEGAMEFASAARGSGVFGIGNQAKFAQTARGTAVAGGLAMSEVTSAANIGSQISRSVGGLGSQGAMAGMKTIGQIGTAGQMGILSEQDIYNVTGQTGAEGRQAYAASQMQKSANFLQTGKGRRLLASIAGKDGSLDPEGVMELMSGGMDIGETMKRDNMMKSKVGRANFIRNEGRLRGAAMQEFGAFLPGMQMQQWAQSKGIDINNMDDRSMLFAQRQLGMGRDEADQAIKMAQHMPEIMQEMHQRQGRDSAMGDYTKTRKGMGVEGIKNRLSQAKESVNNKLQKLGQDFFNDGSEAIDSFIKKLTGDYEQKFSEETEKAYRQTSLGTTGSLAKKELTSMIGTGKGLGAGPAGGLGAFRSQPGIGGLGGILGGKSDAQRFKEAGWDTSGAKSNADLSKMLSNFGDISRAANEPPSEKFLAMGGAKAAWLDAGITSGTISGSGQTRMDSFGKELMDKGTAEQKAAWSKASAPDKARMMNALASSRGITGEGSSFSIPDLQSAMMGKQLSESDRREAIAAAFTGKGPGGTAAAAAGGALGGAAGGLLGPLGSLVGSIGGNWLANKISGSQDKARALGSFLESDDAAKLYSGLRAGGQDAETARKGAVNEIADLQRKKDLTVDETARLQGLQGTLAAAEWEQAKASGGGDAELKKIAMAHGMDPGQVEAASAAGAAVQGSAQAEKFRGLALSLGKQAEKKMSALQGAGVASFEGGKVTLNSASMGTGARDIASRLLRATQLEAQAGQQAAAGDLKGSYATEQSAQALRGETGDQINGMSVEDKRKVARDLARAGLGDESGMLFSAASAEDRLKKSIKRRGADKAVAESLGVTTDPEMLKAMKGATAQEKAMILASSKGITSQEGISDIKAAFEASAKGKTGEASALLRQVSGSDEAKRAEKAQSLQQAAEKDPLADAMNKNLDQIKKGNDRTNDYLKLIVQHTAGTEQGLAAIDKKDAEDSGANGGSPTPAAGHK